MLDAADSSVETERNSRKEPFSDAEATALIASVKSVLVAKGKKVRELSPDETSLDDLKGPTGNYRAPIIKVDQTLLVGFNEERLRQLV